MNLIHDEWIPVRRRNGDKIKIAPWQITEDIGTENEIVELAAPRPDFNGALIQFLIGLIQTTCTPKNTGEWRKWFNNPPQSEELKKRFETIKYAFNLDGDGQRFMQELGLVKEKKYSVETIDKMIIDMPGEQTLKFNSDHFIKRNTVNQLCPNCMTMALFTLQLNAPSGGAGHLTSLRGGGPLTTLICGKNIWETTWSSILEENKFRECANFGKNDDDYKFTWLTSKRNSENGLKTTPKDVHPAQLYWATPRRIFAIFENAQRQTTCDLCGEKTEQIVKQYCTKPRGTDYKGNWQHPLSPMYFKTGNKKKNESDMWLPVHQHEHLGYKHWLGYVLNENDNGKDKRRPALVVSNMINNEATDFRVWAFGYDMDNMKACCWHEGIMPVLLVDKKYREAFIYYSANLIKAADNVAKYLAWYIKAALYNLEIETNKNKNFGFIKTQFWKETETGFYNILKNLRDFIVANSDGTPEKILKGWLNHLATKAEEIFDDVTQSGEFNAVNPGRIAKAWNSLIREIYNDKTKDILGLAVTPKPIGGKKIKKQKV